MFLCVRERGGFSSSTSLYPSLTIFTIEGSTPIISQVFQKFCRRPPMGQSRTCRGVGEAVLVGGLFWSTTDLSILLPGGLWNVGLLIETSSSETSSSVSSSETASA